MSWLVDAAKNAANKAEAALQKLDKDGGEVVVAAKRELLASSDDFSASPAPPPRQLPRRQSDARASAPRRDRLTPRPPAERSAAPEPATRTPPEATTRGNEDTSFGVDVSSSVAGAKAKTTTTDAVSDAAARASRRAARRLALLDHVAALIARQNAEASAAARDAAAARHAHAAEAATTSLRGDAAAGDADAAAARLRALRGARAAAQDAADARLAELAGVGGERARRLAAQQRALVSATRRRDDAADAVAAAERRIAAARTVDERLETQTDARLETRVLASEASNTLYLEEIAALETKLRSTRADAEACSRRLAATQSSIRRDPNENGSNERTDPAEPVASARFALESRLRSVADALFAEQSRCDSLKSDKAALAFRLESARAEISRMDATRDERVRVLGPSADADAEAWTDSDDDDDDVESAFYRRRFRKNEPQRGARNTRVSHTNVTPKELAYRAVTFVFGGSARNERVAREVSEAVSALDRLTLHALSAWGKTRVARVAFFSYAVVMHAYVFALLWYGGGGPRATDTETATGVG